MVVKRGAKGKNKGKMTIDEYFARYKTHDTMKGIVILDTKTGKKRYIPDKVAKRKRVATRTTKRKSTTKRRQPRNPFEINNVPTLI